MNSPKASVLVFTVFSLALSQSARAQDADATPGAPETAAPTNQNGEPQPLPPPEFDNETKPTQESESPPAAEPPPAPSSNPIPPPQPDTQEGQAKTPANETDDYDEPAEKDENDGFEMPSFSVRIDPINWLIEGRLGLELEIGVWKFISFEMVPVFVANDEPPIFNFGGEPDNLTQHSNGLGPISGSSFGLGFWLSGKALQEGTVLRLIYTNYGYTYKTDSGDTDKVDFTERRIYGMIGSLSRWGIFTIGSGLGIGVELNQKQRCVDSGTTEVVAHTSGCEDDEEQRIAIEPDGRPFYDINGWLHPVYLTFRIALGITLDFD